MNIPIDQVKNAILFTIAFILCTAVHEFGHAWVATKLGDPTPRLQGRLTLLPTRHIDPIGTLAFPFFFTLMASSLAMPLLGWGKPVVTVPAYFTRRFSRTTGSMLVAIAGPAMNLVLAFVISVAIVIGLRTGLLGDAMAATLVRHLVHLNLVLFIFNLLPIPPLDGGSVLAWVLPRSLQPVVDVLQKWGGLILILIVLSPAIVVVALPVELLEHAWMSVLRMVAGR